MGREKRFVSYCDIPLQHVSANVLGRMRRPGSPAEYRDDDLADARPRSRHLPPNDVHRRTSRARRAKDFGELHDFVAWARFDHLGVFPYSPEEGTPASRMEDLPTRRTAERRLAKLMELQQSIAAEKNQGKVGQTFDAIVTGVCAETEHLLEGRLIGQAPEIDGRLLINDGIDLLPKDLPAFARVEITEAFPYDLVGGVV